MLNTEDIQSSINNTLKTGTNTVVNNKGKHAQDQATAHSKDYPKLDITILESLNLKGIKLTINLQNAFNEKEIVEEIFLPKDETGFTNNSLSKENQFQKMSRILTISQDHQTKKSTFTITNFSKEKKESEETDKIAESVQITVMPEGSLVCEDITLNGTLNINAPSGIVIVGNVESNTAMFESSKIAIFNDVQTNNLVLKAKDISNQAEIQIKNDLNIITEKFINSGVIASNCLKIKSSGEILNNNTIRAKISEVKGLSLENKQYQPKLNNTGLLDVKKLYLTTKAIDNSGYVLSESCKSEIVLLSTNPFDVVINNTGVFSTKERLELNANGKIINNENGLFESKNKLTLLSSTAIENSGEVSAKSLHIKSKNIHNASSGSIVSEILIAHNNGTTNTNLFINDGLILISNECYIISHSSFINNQTCLCRSNLNIFLAGQLIDQGQITSGSDIKICTVKKELFDSKNKVTADGNIYILSLDEVLFKKKIESEKNLTIKALNDIIIAQHGLLKANKKLTINSFQNIKNSGSATGNETYIKALKSLLQSKNSNLFGRQSLEIVANSMKNESLISSEGTLNATIKSEIIQEEEALLQGSKLLSLKTQGKLISKGLIQSEQGHVDIWAKNLIENSGHISGKTIGIRSNCLLKNVLTGIILAGEKLNIFSKEILENSGGIESQGKANISADILLKNFHEGKMVAIKDLKAWSKYILSNAGKISGIGNSTVIAEATHFFENLDKAEISSKKDLSVKSGYRLDNSGKVDSKNKMYLEAIDILKNHQRGDINSGKSIELISKWVLDNEGKINSEGKLKADASFILENQRAGKISAKDALELINASIVQNCGAIEGQKNVSLYSRSVLNNIIDGNIKAGEAIDLISSFVLDNAAIISAKNIHANAVALLQNSLAGRMEAQSELKLNSENFLLNRGSLKSQNNIKAKAQTIYNFSTGSISAKDSIELISKDHIEQQGLIKSKKVLIESLSLKNSGEMVSLKTLSMNIKEVLLHCKQGKITSGDCVSILTKNLHLMGQLIVEGKASITIEDNFDYNSETLWACGILKLMLKKGYDFRKPLRVKGSLEIETENDFGIHTTLEAGKNFKANASNVTVEGEQSGVFAGAKLSISVNNLLKIGDPVSPEELNRKKASNATLCSTTKKHKYMNMATQYKSDGSFLASNNGIELKAGCIQNKLGEIYTAGDLVLEALYKIENSGDITAEGNAKMVTPLFEHKLMTLNYDYGTARGALALSQAPTMTIGKNAEIKANTELLGGQLHVGKELINKGNFQALSFEAYCEWEDTVNVKGSRKAGPLNGLFRGHKRVTVQEHHRNTTNVYDSQVSAGKEIKVQGTQFTNQGALRTEQLNVRFKNFHNGSNTLSQKHSVDDSMTELSNYNRESRLFGTVAPGQGYIYGPKYPLQFNATLAPPVRILNANEIYNPIAEALYAPIMEKDLVRRALQDKYRSGYLNKDAGSPEEILMQLRADTYAFWHGLRKPKPHLKTPQNYYTVHQVDGDGDCMFASTFYLIKKYFNHNLQHPIHQITDKHAFRKWICDHLHERSDTLKEQIRTIILNNQGYDALPPGEYSESVFTHAQIYHYINRNLGENAAQSYLNTYLSETTNLYIQAMRIHGTWGGDLELGLIARLNNVSIRVSHANRTLTGYEFVRQGAPVGDNSNHPMINIVYTGDHYDALENAPSPAPPSLTLQDLAVSQKAMLFYQQQTILGRPSLSPYLYSPVTIKNEINLGHSGESVVRANNANLIGENNSRITQNGVVDIDNVLKIKVDEFNATQRTHEVAKQVVKNKKEGAVVEKEIHSVSASGITKAGTLEINANSVLQVGGELSSGEGGSQLIIRDQLLLRALETNEITQGKITRKGNNYEIEPVFIPAGVMSRGSQTIIVTQGDFISEGSFVASERKTTIEANNILIKHVLKNYNKCSYMDKCGKFGEKRKKEGGTSFSTFPSMIHGGEGVFILARTGKLEVLASKISSGGDVELKAKQIVEILNSTAEETAYSHDRRMKGFKLTDQKNNISKENVLKSQIAIAGNLKISADDVVHIRSLYGFVEKDVSIEALNVIIENSVEKQIYSSKTKTLGVSFFGSQAMEAAMNGENSRKVFESLLENDSFYSSVKRLANTKDKSEKINESVKTFIEGWRLAGMVADACNEMAPDGTRGDVTGALTDRWGLTTPYEDENGMKQRKFNPSFKFTYEHSHTKRELYHNIPTTLMIGGNLNIVADVVKIDGGSEITAENITIYARRLLEMKAGMEAQKTKHRQGSENVRFRLDGSLDGGGINRTRMDAIHEQYKHTILNARNALQILSQGTVKLQGVELVARKIEIKTIDLLIESIQDQQKESTQSAGIHVSSNSGQINYGKSSKKREWVNKQSIIKAYESLEIFVDYLKQKGSILESNNKLNIKGFSGDRPKSWVTEDIVNYEKDRNLKLDIGGSKAKGQYPVSVYGSYTKHDKQGLARSSVFAPNMLCDVPLNVNRNKEQAQVITKDKTSSYVLPNPGELISTLKDIKTRIDSSPLKRENQKEKSKNDLLNQKNVKNTPKDLYKNKDPKSKSNINSKPEINLKTKINSEPKKLTNEPNSYEPSHNASDPDQSTHERNKNNDNAIVKFVGRLHMKHEAYMEESAEYQAELFTQWATSNPERLIKVWKVLSTIETGTKVVGEGTKWCFNKISSGYDALKTTKTAQSIAKTNMAKSLTYYYKKMSNKVSNYWNNLSEEERHAVYFACELIPEGMLAMKTASRAKNTKSFTPKKPPNSNNPSDTLKQGSRKNFKSKVVKTGLTLGGTVVSGVAVASDQNENNNNSNSVVGTTAVIFGTTFLFGYMVRRNKLNFSFNRSNAEKTPKNSHLGKQVGEKGDASDILMFRKIHGVNKNAFNSTPLPKEKIPMLPSVDREKLKSDIDAGRLKYRDGSYHKKNDSGSKSKRPSDGEGALGNSVHLEKNSANRIGIDPSTGEIVILYRTHKTGEFHGHVRRWDELSTNYQALMRKQYGLNKNGKLLVKRGITHE